MSWNHRPLAFNQWRLFRLFCQFNSTYYPAKVINHYQKVYPSSNDNLNFEITGLKMEYPKKHYFLWCYFYITCFVWVACMLSYNCSLQFFSVQLSMFGQAQKRNNICYLTKLQVLANNARQSWMVIHSYMNIYFLHCNLKFEL